ncbi:hypothetical protein J4440_03935 [Candidatus Woesearchaeota archaeon]|nr:hypothetical protein [Candidatus Woesearchaeota archaeon]
MKKLKGGNFEFFIVVNTQSLKDKYLKYLPKYKILTIAELESYLESGIYS